MIVNQFLKLPPNLCTFFALITGIAVLPLLIFKMPIFSLIFLLISGGFDILDGRAARAQNRASDCGALFDICSDRFVEFMVILGLYLIAPESRGLLCLLMLGSVLFCVTSFLTVGIFSANHSEKSFHYSRGLMERPEAFAFFASMILFPKLFFYLALLFAILVTFTALVRVHQFYQRKID